MRAVVTGMIATFPLGGVAWDYGQYALGLERLGWEVYYLEDTEWPSYYYNPATGSYEEDDRSAVRFLQEALATLSPWLAQRWHFRSAGGQTYGIEASTFADIIAGADLLLNVSGGCILRDAYRRCPLKVFLDTDPGWNHFVRFLEWDRRPAEEHCMGFRGHDRFFTYAQRLGQADCPLSDFGLTWHPTRPPVVLDCWKPVPSASCSTGILPVGGRHRQDACATEPSRWTTVMTWNNYQRPVMHQGVAYGAKELEFHRIEELPLRVPVSLEIAINTGPGQPPCERWQSLGWRIVDGRVMSATADAYRSYVQGSRGEFSVAKNVYVGTRSGWFSCRSVCYLAAGRPVVLQDTGYSDFLPTGHGLLPFSDLDQAVAAVAAVESDYSHHQEAARDLARNYFDAAMVLGDLLAKLALG